MPTATASPGRNAITNVRRWLYANRRPNALARFLNAISAAHYGSGVLAPDGWVSLETRGRRSGKLIKVPLVAVDFEGERYLVAMLGPETNWLRNVRAAGGRATLRHGRTESVRLEEVEVGQRPPIIRRYLDLAPGARAHIPVDRHATLDQFESVAAGVPVLRIVPETETATPQHVRPS